MGRDSGILAAVILPKHKIAGGGLAFLIEAQDEEEQEKLTTEISKALKGDVTCLSNGVYLILKR
jgi:hypothetical protein